MALIADEVGYGGRSASQWLPSGRLRLIVPLLGIKRSQPGNIERDYCNNGASSILADIENTARQLALSAKEIPINGNNFYI